MQVGWYHIKCNFKLSLRAPSLTFHHLLKTHFSNTLFPAACLTAVLTNPFLILQEFCWVMLPPSSYRGVFKVGVQKSYGLCMRMRAKHHRDYWGRNLLIPGFMHSSGGTPENREAVAYDLCLVRLEEGIAQIGLFVWHKPTWTWQIFWTVPLYLMCYWRSMIAGSWMRRGAGGVLEKGMGYFYGWWICSLPWLCWWFHRYTGMSKLSDCTL